MSLYQLDLIQNKLADSQIFPLVSMRRLENLLGWDRTELISFSDKAGQFYAPFDRRRFGTKKWRHIDNPIGPLKIIQRKINRRILAHIKLPDTIIGGVSGKSVFDNANPHINKKVVVCVDLKNCFPRINHKIIFSIFANGLRCSEEIARILTKLTTFQNRLPQGAPTSTMLANVAILPLHNEVKKIAIEKELSWTFFVDDISISGDKALNAIQPIIDKIQKYNHAVSNKKIKIMPSCTRQEITGLVVNKKTNISAQRVESIQKKIYELSINPSPISRNELASIYGKIAYIKRFNKTQGVHLESMANKVLPSTGELLEHFRKDQIRKCKNSKRHAEY